MRAAIFDVQIRKIMDIGIQETRHFELALPAGSVFQFEAGQFLNIMVPAAGANPAFKRPYSIASPPHWANRIDLCWKRIHGGKATEYLWGLKQGDTIKVQGPLGRFVLKRPLPKRIIFVSTGTGIAPFRSIIAWLLEQEKPAIEIHNLFGNRYDEDILYLEEFESWAKKNPNFHNIFTVSRPKKWTGEKEYVQNLIKKYFPQPDSTHIYICGLTKMIEEVVQTATALGYAKDQIFYEKYD